MNNLLRNTKLPHSGGHEGVGRVVAVGLGPAGRGLSIFLESLVGIRFPVAYVDATTTV